MQSNLKTLFTCDKTVPAWPYFALLIKPLYYVSIIHLNYKMCETWSIIT